MFTVTMATGSLSGPIPLVIAAPTTSAVVPITKR
jgi:hypothetical protein